LSIELISALSIGLPTVIALIFLGKNKGALAIVSAFVIVTACLEILSTALTFCGVNNMPLFHCYTYIEFIFILVIYYKVLKIPAYRIILMFCATLFAVFSIVNLVLWESLLEFNSNQRYVEGFIIMIICVLFFLQLLRKAEFIKLETYPYFWLTSGFLTYFAGTLIVFYLVRRLEDDSADFYWGIHGILNILLNVCYALTLWMGRRASIS